MIKPVSGPSDRMPGYLPTNPVCWYDQCNRY
jgi:hypothetical protein